MDIPTKMYRIDTPDGTSNFAYGTAQSIDHYRKNNPSHKVFSLVCGYDLEPDYFEPMESAINGTEE